MLLGVIPLCFEFNCVVSVTSAQILATIQGFSNLQFHYSA